MCRGISCRRWMRSCGSLELSTHHTGCLSPAPLERYIRGRRNCMTTSSETPGVLPLLPEVKASEQEVRAIVDAIPHAISVFSPDGAVLYVNRAFREFTGFTLEDVMASDFRARLYHPDDLDRVRDERARALPRGVPFETEQRALRKDGEYRWYLVRHYPLRDEQGRLTRWYATGTDIHDRKRAEEKIRQSERERSEEHTSELQSQSNLVCRLLLEKKKKKKLSKL